MIDDLADMILTGTISVASVLVLSSVGEWARLLGWA